MTPSQARNSIKKCLKSLIDPKPKTNEKNEIWRYFNNNCAYCGCELFQKSRKGHIDHLYSEMEGGSNRLSNLVLACDICNGDEKRESDWKEFLAGKYGVDNSEYQKKIKRIEDWIEINGGNTFLSESEKISLQIEFDVINEVLTKSIEKFRQ